MPDEIDKKAADILRHCGYNMLFAVLLIVGGREKLNEFSLDVRKLSHRNI